MDGRQRRPKGRSRDVRTEYAGSPPQHLDTMTQYVESPRHRIEDFSGWPSAYVPSSPAPHGAFHAPLPYDPPTASSMATAPGMYGMPGSSHYTLPDIYNVPGGSSSSFSLPSQLSSYEVPDTPDIMSGYAGSGSSSHVDDLMTMFWKSQARTHQSNAAGNSNNYSLGAHFESGMDIRGTGITQHHGSSSLEDREPPTKEELAVRYNKLKEYQWQTKLKTEPLKTVYERIGAYWEAMPKSTFSSKIKLLNELLDENPPYIESILNNDQNLIAKVALSVNPNFRKLHQGKESGDKRQMADFLRTQFRVYAVEKSKPAKLELGVDRKSEQAPNDYSWAPTGMDKDAQDLLLIKLAHIWNNGKIKANARLTKYGPKVVGQYANGIMHDNIHTARHYAKIMTAAFRDFKKEHKGKPKSYIGGGSGSGSEDLLEDANQSPPQDFNQQYDQLHNLGSYGQLQQSGQYEDQQHLLEQYQQQQLQEQYSQLQYPYAQYGQEDPLGHYSQHVQQDPFIQYAQPAQQSHHSHTGSASHQVLHNQSGQPMQLSNAELDLLAYEQEKLARRSRRKERQQALHRD